MLELKNSVQQNKKATESFNNRMSEVEKRLSELEDNLFKDTQLIRYMAVNLNKAKKTIQNLKNTIRK